MPANSLASGQPVSNTAGGALIETFAQISEPPPTPAPCATHMSSRMRKSSQPFCFSGSATSKIHASSASRGYSSGAHYHDIMHWPTPYQFTVGSMPAHALPLTRCSGWSTTLLA